MRLFKSLYSWILIAFISGSLLGIYNPQLAILMEPLGTNFIKLVKIFISPIIFLTIAAGIAQMKTLKKLGKIGIKALVYFEVVSTIALLIGWAGASILKPGTILHTEVTALDPKLIFNFLEGAKHLSVLDFIENMIPLNILEPFIKNDMLQTLLIAVLFGTSLLLIGESQAKGLREIIEWLMKSLFQMFRLIMYLAPIGVFGAMAFTVGKLGGQFLLPLLSLIGTFYLVGAFFILFVLGSIARLAGFSILSFLRYLLPEILLVLGTSSSESALPQLLTKLEKLGCQRETVGMVVPIGYSFNLDGTNIYITLASLFIAQALGVHLTFQQELILFATAMLSSKGAAGVTGAGFITLAATLLVIPSIPVVGIVLILGIDRFMSEARSLINYIGNGVAAIVISRWEQEVSKDRLNQSFVQSSE